MTPDQWKTFCNIADMCETESPPWSSINVASNVRSAAIIAARDFIQEVLRTREAELKAHQSLYRSEHRRE